MSQDPVRPCAPIVPEKCDSTGPRTPGGKAVSSMNALKHGLTARTALLPGEDPDEFRDYVWSVIEDLQPRGPVQAELAHRVGVLMWKRKRLEGAEEQALANLQDRYAQKTEARLARQERYAETDEQRQEVQKEREQEEANGAVWDVNQILADQFGGRHGGTLERLARYEQRLSQQIESSIRLLLKLQNRRQYQEQQQRREGQTDRNTRPRPAAEGEPDRPGPDRCAPQRPKARHDAPPPPPPAPAQNELPPEPVAGAETGPPDQPLAMK